MLEATPIRAQLSALVTLLLLHTAFAASVDATDPVGDENTRVVAGVAIDSAVECHDAAIDFTRLAIDTSGGILRITATFADITGTPYCVNTGQTLSLERGTTNRDLYLSNPANGNYLDIYFPSGNWSYIEGEVDDRWFQAEPTVTHHGNSIMLELDLQLSWTIHTETGEYAPYNLAGTTFTDNTAIASSNAGFPNTRPIHIRDTVTPGDITL